MTNRPDVEAFYFLRRFHSPIPEAKWAPRPSCEALWPLIGWIEVTSLGSDTLIFFGPCGMPGEALPGTPDFSANLADTGQKKEKRRWLASRQGANRWEKSVWLAVSIALKGLLACAQQKI